MHPKHEIADLEAAEPGTINKNARQVKPLSEIGTAAADPEKVKKFKLSRQRWLILFAIVSCNMLGTISSQFEPILGVMLELLELSRDKYVYIGQVFFYLSAFGSMLDAWIIDKYGLKITMYLLAALNLVRYTFRILMFSPSLAGWQQFKFAYWIVEGISSTQAGVLFICLPLKVSENWFSKSERSLAWTIMVSSGSIGATVGLFFFPRLIHGIQDVYLLAYLNAGCALLTLIIVPTCVTRSNPKYPPSERMQARMEQIERSLVAEEDQPSWLETIKMLLSQPQIMLHLFHKEIFAGLSGAGSPLMQDILASSGHSMIFVGNLLATNSLMQIPAQTALSALVHRVQDITLTCKLTSLVETLVNVAYMLSILYYGVNEWLIMSVAVVFVCLRAWKQPNFNEMQGELISGSAISEATISAFGCTIYCLLTNLSQVLFVQLIRELPDGKADYTNSIRVTLILCLLNTLAYFILFKGASESKEINRRSRSMRRQSRNRSDSIELKETRKKGS